MFEKVKLPGSMRNNLAGFLGFSEKYSGKFLRIHLEVIALTSLDVSRNHL